MLSPILSLSSPSFWYMLPQCFFDLWPSLCIRYVTQMECRNSSGKYRKVTGVLFQPRADSMADLNASRMSKTKSWRRKAALLQEHLLVSTNDDRIRLFQMEDYSMVCKYKVRYFVCLESVICLQLLMYWSET